MEVALLVCVWEASAKQKERWGMFNHAYVKPRAVTELLGIKILCSYNKLPFGFNRVNVIFVFEEP